MPSLRLLSHHASSRRALAAAGVDIPFKGLVDAATGGKELVVPDPASVNTFDAALSLFKKTTAHLNKGLVSAHPSVVYYSSSSLLPSLLPSLPGLKSFSLRVPSASFSLGKLLTPPPRPVACPRPPPNLVNLSLTHPTRLMHTRASPW